MLLAGSFIQVPTEHHHFKLGSTACLGVNKEVQTVNKFENVLDCSVHN